MPPHAPASGREPPATPSGNMPETPPRRAAFGMVWAPCCYPRASGRTGATEGVNVGASRTFFFFFVVGVCCVFFFREMDFHCGIASGIIPRLSFACLEGVIRDGLSVAVPRVPGLYLCLIYFQRVSHRAARFNLTSISNCCIFISSRFGTWLNFSALQVT